MVAVGALTMSIIMLYFVGSPSPLLGKLKACGRKLAFTNKGDGLCFASFGELSALLTKAHTEEIEVNATDVMGYITDSMRDAASTQWSFGNDRWPDFVVEILVKFTVHGNAQHTEEEMMELVEDIERIAATHAHCQTVIYPDRPKDVMKAATSGENLCAADGGIDPTLGVMRVGEWTPKGSYDCSKCKGEV